MEIAKQNDFVTSFSFSIGFRREVACRVVLPDVYLSSDPTLFSACVGHPKLVCGGGCGEK
jgi:hypothetical protein